MKRITGTWLEFTHHNSKMVAFCGRPDLTKLYHAYQTCLNSDEKRG